MSIKRLMKYNDLIKVDNYLCNYGSYSIILIFSLFSINLKIQIKFRKHLWSFTDPIELAGMNKQLYSLS